MRNVTTGQVLTAGAAIGVGVVLWKVFGPTNTGDPDTGPTLPPNAHPTLSPGVAATIADGIYGALYAGGGTWTGDTTEDEAAVVSLLTMANNSDDVALIIDKYGTRGWLWTGYMTLPAAVVEYLSEGDRAEINDDYASKGITFRF